MAARRQHRELAGGIPRLEKQSACIRRLGPPAPGSLSLQWHASRPENDAVPELQSRRPGTTVPVKSISSMVMAASLCHDTARAVQRMAQPIASSAKSRPLGRRRVNPRIPVRGDPIPPSRMNKATRDGAPATPSLWFFVCDAASHRAGTAVHSRPGRQLIGIPRCPSNHLRR